MNRNRKLPSLALNAVLCLAAFGVSQSAAKAGAISLGVWYEFSFTDAGVGARGCAPADAGGQFCIPSSGTPTTFLDAPPWTFIAPVGGAIIRLVDAFSTVDQFEILDNGVPLGITSAPNPLGDCGDDPAVCFLNADASKGTFLVPAGARSITIVPTLSPDGLGSAFFIAEDPSAAAVPEPATYLLLGIGCLGFYSFRRRQIEQLKQQTEAI